MVSEKVVTVTLPSGTKVSCREGLAARLAPSKPSSTKKAAPRRKPVAAESDTSDDE